MSFVALLSLLAAPAAAGFPVAVEGSSRLATELAEGPYPGAPAEVATAFVAEHGAALGLSPTQLRVEREATWRGRTAVHLVQLHGGVPVQGGGAVIRTAADGRVGFASATWIDGLTVDPTPSVAAERAAALALAELPGARAHDPELVVRKLGRGGRLVWTVELFAEPTGWWRAEVDAHSGELLLVRDLRAGVDGRAYAHNLDAADLATVPLDGLDGSSTSMTSGVAVVQTTTFVDGGQEMVQLATSEPGGDFLFDPDGTVEDPFAEVNVYHHIAGISAYFEAVHGHDTPGQTSAVVSYRDEEGTIYDNAYFQYGFDGRYSLTFGEGSAYDFGHDPDVVVHEFSHGVVDDIMPLLQYIGYPINLDAFGMHAAPGGLVEGMPDYWAATFHDDPNMATAIVGIGPLRDLENDLKCPGDVFGEAHEDGKIAGGAAWDARVVLGAEAADQLIFGTLQTLTGVPTFEEVSAAMLEVADDLVADGLTTEEDVAALEAKLVERGLTTCGRSVPATAEPVQMYWFGADLIDYSACSFLELFNVHIAPPFQLSVDSPEGAEVTALELSVDLASASTLVDGDLAWSVFVHRGDLVEYEVMPLDLGGGVAFDIPVAGLAYDLEVPSTEQTLELTLTADDLELVGGETYYIGLLGQNCRTLVASVTAELIYEPVDTEDTEVVDTAPSDTEPDTDDDPPADSGATDTASAAKGCGCDGGSTGAGYGLVALGALALRRRRGGAR